MTVIVRALRPDVPSDAEGFAHVRRLALPYILFTAESVRHTAAHVHADARYRPLVAEEDGEIIGTAQVHLAHDSPEPGQGCLNVYVRPDRTHRGAGRLLVAAGEAYLAEQGATRLFAWALDEPPPTAPSPSGAATPGGVRPISSVSTWRTAASRPCFRFRRTSNCAPPPTSRTIPGRCSSWTRRRCGTNRAMWPSSSATTRRGWRRPGGIRCWTGS